MVRKGVNISKSVRRSLCCGGVRGWARTPQQVPRRQIPFHPSPPSAPPPPVRPVVQRQLDTNKNPRNFSFPVLLELLQ